MKTLFEHYSQSDTLHFKFAKGEPSVKDREFHDYHELVLFLGGSAYFISKSIQQQLTPGSLLLIPKGHFHQFCISFPSEYERCILGFYETLENRRLVREIMTEIKIFAEPSEQIRDLFKRLSEISASELSENDKLLFINAGLTQILIYLKHTHASAVRENILISPIVANALAYIDTHFSEQLTVSSIAEQLYISPSALAHKFSRELNISVYRYITKKRLSAAHALILRGEAMTSASSVCGFNDYSCFYRLYKKYYKN